MHVATIKQKQIIKGITIIKEITIISIYLLMLEVEVVG